MRWLLYIPLWLILNVTFFLIDIVRLRAPTYLPLREFIRDGEIDWREIERTSCNCPPFRFLVADHLPSCPQAKSRRS